MPGTHLTKLNGPHGRILDDLAICACTHRRIEHAKGKCPCGCVGFKETSRIGFVMYDFRHTFATRAAEAGMPVATLAKILGHADLRSVMRYVHVGQEAQDRAMEELEAHRKAQNILGPERSSGFRPVKASENRDSAGSGGNAKEGVNARKIN